MKIDKEIKQNQIKMMTNSAYLLNTWFPNNSTLFSKTKEFIEKLHREKSHCFIEVTFKRVER